MNFDTFWASIIANIERRGGLDTTDPRVVVALSFDDLRSMLQAAYDLGKESC